MGGAAGGAFGGHHHGALVGRQITAHEFGVMQGYPDTWAEEMKKTLLDELKERGIDPLTAEQLDVVTAHVTRPRNRNDVFINFIWACCVVIVGLIVHWCIWEILP